MRIRVAIVLLSFVLPMQGCASFMAAQTSANPAQDANRQTQEIFTVPSTYPATVVTTDGQHALVMPPCGNLSVVVKPDGSHATAVVNGNFITIVTP